VPSPSLGSLGVEHVDVEERVGPRRIEHRQGRLTRYQEPAGGPLHVHSMREHRGRYPVGPLFEAIQGRTTKLVREDRDQAVVTLRREDEWRVGLPCPTFRPMEPSRAHRRNALHAPLGQPGLQGGEPETAHLHGVAHPGIVRVERWTRTTGDRSHEQDGKHAPRMGADRLGGDGMGRRTSRRPHDVGTRRRTLMIR